MNSLDLDRVRDFVNENIVDFHGHRIKSLEELKLDKLLTNNPYLFKANNITTAGELIAGLLDAFLSSSEEELFGDFLERLAVFTAEMTCGGQESATPRVDLEVINDGVQYVISIGSGPSLGDSSQQDKLEQDLKNAVIRIIQSKRGGNVRPVLGICYGKTKTSYLRGYMKVVGQNFWYLISENRDLYTDIIQPIGYRSKDHNEIFLAEKSRVTNRFTKQFIDRFCDADGTIDWVKLVEFNSGNFGLDTFLP
jgi:hypothetical protein